jgi:hypothetical protein
MAGQTRRGGVGGISLASGGGAGGRGVAVGEGGKARGNQEPTGLGSLARSIGGRGRTHARTPLDFSGNTGCVLPADMELGPKAQYPVALPFLLVRATA